MALASVATNNRSKQNLRDAEIKQIIETTRCSPSVAEEALHECNNQLEAAVTWVLDHGGMDSWIEPKNRKPKKTEVVEERPSRVESGNRRGKQRGGPARSDQQQATDQSSVPIEPNGGVDSKKPELNEERSKRRESRNRRGKERVGQARNNPQQTLDKTGVVTESKGRNIKESVNGDQRPKPGQYGNRRGRHRGGPPRNIPEQTPDHTCVRTESKGNVVKESEAATLKPTLIKTPAGPLSFAAVAGGKKLEPPTPLQSSPPPIKSTSPTIPLQHVQPSKDATPSTAKESLPIVPVKSSPILCKPVADIFEFYEAQPSLATPSSAKESSPVLTKSPVKCSSLVSKSDVANPDIYDAPPQTQQLRASPSIQQPLRLNTFGYAETSTMSFPPYVNTSHAPPSTNVPASSNYAVSVASTPPSSSNYAMACVPPPSTLSHPQQHQVQQPLHQQHSYQQQMYNPTYGNYPPYMMDPVTAQMMTHMPMRDPVHRYPPPPPGFSGPPANHMYVNQNMYHYPPMSRMPNQIYGQQQQRTQTYPHDGERWAWSGSNGDPAAVAQGGYGQQKGEWTQENSQHKRGSQM